MASSSSAVTIAMPAAVTRSREALFRPLRPPAAAPRQGRPSSQLMVRASSSASAKEKVVGGLTAAALAAMVVIPEVAEAAQPGLSPSLKNFLLSIAAGGVVLGVIVGAVIAVANFDPVKRS